ncbi:hypothetical protein KA005_65670 [bacterium]|nr:hypothetical protein [bacterium]
MKHLIENKPTHLRRTKRKQPNRKGDDALARENIAHLKWLRKKLEETDDDFLKELMDYTIEMLMSAEAPSDRSPS